MVRVMGLSLQRIGEAVLPFRQTKKEAVRSEKSQPVALAQTASKLHPLNRVLPKNVIKSAPEAQKTQQGAVNKLSGRSNVLTPKTVHRLPAWVKPVAYTALTVIGVAVVALAAQKFLGAANLGIAGGAGAKQGPDVLGSSGDTETVSGSASSATNPAPSSTQNSDVSGGLPPNSAASINSNSSDSPSAMNPAPSSTQIAMLLEDCPPSSAAPINSNSSDSSSATNPAPSSTQDSDVSGGSPSSSAASINSNSSDSSSATNPAPFSTQGGDVSGGPTPPSPTSQRKVGDLEVNSERQDPPNLVTTSGDFPFDRSFEVCEESKLKNTIALARGTILQAFHAFFKNRRVEIFHPPQYPNDTKDARGATFAELEESNSGPFGKGIGYGTPSFDFQRLVPEALINSSVDPFSPEVFEHNNIERGKALLDHFEYDLTKAQLPLFNADSDRVFWSLSTYASPNLPEYLDYQKQNKYFNPITPDVLKKLYGDGFLYAGAARELYKSLVPMASKVGNHAQNLLPEKNCLDGSKIAADTRTNMMEYVRGRMKYFSHWLPAADKLKHETTNKGDLAYLVGKYGSTDQEKTCEKIHAASSRTNWWFDTIWSRVAYPLEMGADVWYGPEAGTIQASIRSKVSDFGSIADSKLTTTGNQIARMVGKNSVGDVLAQNPRVTGLASFAGGIGAVFNPMFNFQTISASANIAFANLKVVSKMNKGDRNRKARECAILTGLAVSAFTGLTVPAGIVVGVYAANRFGIALGDWISGRQVFPQQKSEKKSQFV